MKKTYMKPDIFVESFSLTQSIASGCTAQKYGLGTPSSSNPQSCGWDYNGVTYYSNGLNPDCNANELVLVCYNAPNGNVMFGS